MTASTTPSLSDLLSPYSNQAQIKTAGLDNVMLAVNSSGNINDIASQGFTPVPVTQPYKDASGNLVTPAPNTYAVTSGDGTGGSLNYFFTVDPKTGSTSPISSATQNLTYNPGSPGGFFNNNPFVKDAALVAAAIYAPELLDTVGTDTLGADVIPASTATGATSAAAADEASGLTGLGLGQAGTEAASGALPAAAGATAGGSLPVDLANTAFVPTAGATAGDLAIATDPVAANIAAGMTPEAASAAAAAGVAANATQGLTAAQAAALAGTSGLADAAAAAKLASSLTNSSGSIPVTASGGTTGGSSSGPWNQTLNPGVSKIGASKTTAWADPLSGLMTSIVPTYSPSQGALGNIMSHEYQGELSPTSGYAKGGKVKNDLDKFDPDFVKVIKERVPDHHHPNYNGKALFRTGGLGKHVQGPGTGQSDDIPAMLADGEYVFDADTVSALGDGSNKAGAEALDKMREAIRKHKRSAPIDKIPPKAKSPLEYLKGKHK